MRTNCDAQTTSPEVEEPPSITTARPSTNPTKADILKRALSPRGPAVNATEPAAKVVQISEARRERFPVGPDARQFQKKFFPGATAADWNDWRWQLRSRIKSLSELERMFLLSDDERDAVIRHNGSLPVGITPYYASLLDRQNPDDGLRRTHIPVGQEYIRTPGEADDPLGEDHDAAVPGLVHRYPDRVLFLATGFCSTYCRYCTRSRMVGEAGGDYSFSKSQWEKALQYIEANPQIRDVLISGGDPLTLSDDKLDYLLGRLRAIRHVEFVRLGTKVPVVLPMRVTRALVRTLRKHHPLWMSIHVTHPSELTPEMTQAVTRLADAGIPLGSQTVLLKGINDEVETMKSMMHGLLMRRVKPYYLYQCDPITGSAQFRTPVDKGIEIIEGLRGHTTGYAVPQYVIDAPGGGGKIPLLPEYVVGRDGDDLLLRNFEGGVYRYSDPGGTVGSDKSGGLPVSAPALLEG
ncbi:MAG: KamA family radical SAM protein [Alphaproteobacteria bacterium]|nr:KamA family radical SAM protein [Alphaproteobacteria bacterium]